MRVSVVTDMLYKCVLQVDGTPQSVEIMDTSAACEKNSDPYLQWAEAFVVVYSITDKDSYQQAASTVQVIIASSFPPSLGATLCCVVLPSPTTQLYAYFFSKLKP